MASNKKKKYKSSYKSTKTSKHTEANIEDTSTEPTPIQVETTKPKNTLQLWLSLLAVVVITLVAYSSAFDNKLTNWDDNFYVNDNPVLREINKETLGEMFFSDNKTTRYYMGNYHPLTMLSLAIDFQIGKANKDGDPNPKPYITTNVIFHVVNTALVFLLIYLLWGRVEIATIAAVLFGVHTLHVESVAWISERKDVLYTFFFLLSLISYLRYTAQEKVKWIVLSFAFFLLSLFAKGQAVSLAPTLVLIDWFRRRNLISVKVFVEKIPFFVIALLFGLIAIEAQNHGQAIHRIDEYPFYMRILFASFGFVQYLIKLVVPNNLAAIYPYPILENMQPTGELFLHLLGTLAVVALGVWAVRKKHTNLIFGFAFFIINIALLLQLIPVGSAIMADRYSYIPSIGIHALIAFAFWSLFERFSLPRVVVYGIVGAYTLALGLYTNKQVDTWQNSMTVWTQTLKVSPQSIVAWNNRGSLKEKRAKEGEEVTSPELMKSAILDFNEALKIKPDYTTALYNRGVAFHDLKQYTAAFDDFNTALKHDPTFGDAYHNRGLVKDKLGKFKEAIADFDKAIKFKPTEQKILVNRGVSNGKMGNYTEAIRNFNLAIEMDPKNSSAYSNRGLANDHTGKLEQALADYSTAIELDSMFVTAYMNRNLVYQKQEKWELAVADINMALQLNPKFVNLYYQRATIFERLKRYDLACNDLRQAKQRGMKGLDNAIKSICGRK